MGFGATYTRGFTVVIPLAQGQSAQSIGKGHANMASQGQDALMNIQSLVKSSYNMTIKRPMDACELWEVSSQDVPQLNYERDLFQ